MNAPLVVSGAGSTVHDATFWQPLALGAGRRARARPDSGEDPALRRRAVGPRSRVRDRRRPGRSGAAAARRPVGRVVQARGGRGDPRDRMARRRPRSAARRSRGTGSPCELPSRESSLQRDVKLYVALNGALNDAAIVVWGAKRAYRSPRPISMIRYLAFQGQSSDPGAVVQPEGCRSSRADRASRQRVRACARRGAGCWAPAGRRRRRRRPRPAGSPSGARSRRRCRQRAGPLVRPAGCSGRAASTLGRHRTPAD